MNVSELKAVLAELETLGWGNTLVCFSYDCRSAARHVDIVDLVENTKKGHKQLYFREAEDKETWERRNKYDEDYNLKTTNILSSCWKK